jgi:hypothetical protein
MNLVFGVMLLLTASVLIGITIPSQYVNASFCNNIINGDVDVDLDESDEAGNATMMMTNQTEANGNMTGGTNSTT